MDHDSPNPVRGRCETLVPTARPNCVCICTMSATAAGPELRARRPRESEVAVGRRFPNKMMRPVMAQMSVAFVYTVVLASGRAVW